MAGASWRDELRHRGGSFFLVSDTVSYGNGHHVEEHLGNPHMLPVIVCAFVLITAIIPYVAWKLWQLHQAGIGTSPAYAVALLLSGLIYWGALLMQIVALARDVWATHAGVLRLLWMLLGATGRALQIYAFSKFLWMWVGYARGVGELTSPKVRVGKGDNLLVTGLVVITGANFIAQVVIAALFYDLAEEEGDEHTGLRLKEVGELLDFGLECIWFAVTLRLICAIPRLRPQSLGRATRLELQQYSQLGHTGRAMFVAHAIVWLCQIVALVFFGNGDGESWAAALQLAWFLMQIGYQTDVMNKVYENYMLSLIAVEGAVETGVSKSYLSDVAGPGDEVGEARVAKGRWLDLEGDQCGWRQALGAAAYLLFLIAAMATAIAVGAMIVALHTKRDG